ncbi:apolipoprotein acyltransferase [Palleronia sediminis]|uniref:Apolipoprotein acyltransferase n=1 Tax=Palleronia sediminis TaxID=2547833 RepID=A0A4R6AL74_9RHOB|nr:apolipoprotein acyltransferase [Palleronia sediminis]TDL84175.1 apolipoprotein acyltransferase [Palleronia sediminis]
MIVIAGALGGAVFGWRNAARQGGTRADKLQYAVATAIAGSLLGFVLTLIVDRLL